MTTVAYVWVYVPEFAGDELYVFDDEEAANKFARTRGEDPKGRIREEPILDMQFVRALRAQR